MSPPTVPRPHRIFKLIILAAFLYGSYCMLAITVEEDQHQTEIRKKIIKYIEERYPVMKLQEHKATKEELLDAIMTAEISHLRELTGPGEPRSPPYHEPVGLREEFRERTDRVQSVCKKYGLGEHGEPNSWEFLLDRKHKLSWCNIFKAASSSWIYNFNILSGYSEKELKKSRKTPVQLARMKYPRPSVTELKEALRDSISFMIVRHPFERLISAYRNKYEKMQHKFYHNISRVIVNRYRRQGHNVGVKGPTFDEFVRYILDVFRKKEHYDEHWAPYYLFCTPCHVNYTVIAKVETLPRDQDYIIHRANISHLVKPQQLNKAKGSKTDSVAKDYFSLLTKQEMEELYGIYNVDFEMFDYDPKAYFDIVKKTNKELPQKDEIRNSKKPIQMFLHRKKSIWI